MQIRNIKFNWKIAFIIGLIITLFSGCEVQATDRYQYNTSWDDQYLGIKNIEMIFNRFNVSDDDINNIYDDFVYSFSKIKELYPDVKLYDLFFYKYDYRPYSSSVAYTVSNGFSKNESLPYINLIPGSNSTDVNWTTNVNSKGTIAQSDFFDNSAGLSTQRSSVYTSSFTVNEVENEDYVLLNGGMTTFSSTYSILYDNQKAYISNSLPGLLVAENEYISTDELNQPEIVPDTIDSTYGYLWSPSTSNVEINLDYKEQNQLIHGEHFIGKDLKSSFVFYYYSGDDIVSFNDYVTRNDYLSTDYGTWYDFYIEPQNLEYLPNNTDFYLNIYATLNDTTATVVEDFLAFHTVEKNSGGTGGDTSGGNLGNITNPSGETTGNINLEDIIASGDSMAGDLTLEQITEKIDFNIIDNPYQALWDDLLNLLTGAMLSYGNQTITFETRTGRHTINSDDIKSPEELKTFLSIFSNTAVLMAMFIEIQKLIIKISEGNASYVLHMGDADMYFYDDCQLF